VDAVKLETGVEAAVVIGAVEGGLAAVVVGVDAVKLETGVEAAVVIGAVVELVVLPVVDVPEELDELPVVEADIKLKRSFTTLLRSFCRLDVAAVVVGVVAGKLETSVEPAVVIGAVIEMAVTPVVDVPEELDELPVVEADTKLKRSLRRLLTSFCRLEVAAVVTPPAVVEPLVPPALE
jgi:hypothetical protein